MSRIVVAIVFKNFACWTGISHIGLNVAAIKRQNENGLRQWMYYLRQK